METIFNIILLVLFAFATIPMGVKGIMDLRAARKAKKALRELRKDFADFLNTALEESVKAEENTQEEQKTEQPDYSTINIVQLKEMAKEKKIKGYYSMKKEELIEALKKEA